MKISDLNGVPLPGLYTKQPHVMVKLYKDANLQISQPLKRKQNKTF